MMQPGRLMQRGKLQMQLRAQPSMAQSPLSSQSISGTSQLIVVAERQHLAAHMCSLVSVGLRHLPAALLEVQTALVRCI